MGRARAGYAFQCGRGTVGVQQEGRAAEHTRAGREGLGQPPGCSRGENKGRGWLAGRGRAGRAVPLPRKIEAGMYQAVELGKRWPAQAWRHRRGNTWPSGKAAQPPRPASQWRARTTAKKGAQGSRARAGAAGQRGRQRRAPGCPPTIHIQHTTARRSHRGSQAAAAGRELWHPYRRGSRPLPLPTLPAAVAAAARAAAASTASHCCRRRCCSASRCCSTSSQCWRQRSYSGPSISWNILRTLSVRLRRGEGGRAWGLGDAGHSRQGGGGLQPGGN